MSFLLFFWVKSVLAWGRLVLDFLLGVCCIGLQRYELLVDIF